MPAVLITLVALLDWSVGHQNVLAGQVVVAPLLAATLLGPRRTAAYGVLALVVATIMGVQDHVYTTRDQHLQAQIIRLTLIVLNSAAAVWAAKYRIAREHRLAQLTRVAEVAQQAILVPLPPRIGHWDLAVTYQSAAEEALIGGDLYAAVATPFGLRVLIGDVCGKGLDAVRLAAQVLASFRERAEDTPDLPTLVHHLHRSVRRHSREEDFVTALLAQLTDQGTVTVASAGHPPPLLLHPGSAAESLALHPRPPLGLHTRPDAALQQVSLTTVQLAPGDRLLLYTDGLSEARGAHTREFLPLTDAARAVQGPTVTHALDHLQRHLLTWSGGALNDDAALVLLEYTPPAVRHTITLPDQGPLSAQTPEPRPA